MERLTYKSSTGDYGGNKSFDNDWQEINAYRNALGKYEDLGMLPQELKEYIPKFSIGSYAYFWYKKHNELIRVEVKGFKIENGKRMSKIYANYQSKDGSCEFLMDDWIGEADLYTYEDCITKKGNSTNED